MQKEFKSRMNYANLQSAGRDLAHVSSIRKIIKFIFDNFIYLFIGVGEIFFNTFCALILN